MAEHERDPRVTETYRALGREEPPLELDAAILAAARRSPRRWAVPVSIAAVVVLAVGVTLRVQLERPEEPVPVALSPKPLSAPEPAAAPPAARERPAEEAVPRRDAAASQLSAEPRQEVQGRIAPAAPAAERMDAVGRASGAKGAPVQTPEQWLERVAKLRAEGRHDEADESLAQFRKRYPEYRIPDAMRARVERR